MQKSSTVKKNFKFKRSWLHYGKKFRVFGGCLKDSMQSSSEMKEW